MSFERTNQISIYAALSPRSDQVVSRAVVTTYSLDLVAMLGLVLSLGGQGEAEFDASPLGLVDAFERVRGKLLVMHQLGRVAVPSRHRSILPLLDTMLHAVSADERKASWHPKLALARYDSKVGAQWRFWIGSRNLTGSTDLDAGLLLIADQGKGGQVLGDIAELAAGLLQEARWSPSELAELGRLKWRGPPGVVVRRLFWRRVGEERSFLDIPTSGKPEKLVCVSPFVNRQGLRELRKAIPVPMTLLTTARAASDCAGFEGVEFRIAGTPEPEAHVSADISHNAGEEEFAYAPTRGVHAKLIMTLGRKTADLWLGSANLTRHGLRGPNAEATAIVKLSNPEIAESLNTFVQTSLDFRIDTDDPERLASEQARRALDQYVSSLLESSMVLRESGDSLLLEVNPNFDQLLSVIQISVASFVLRDTWVDWETGMASIRLSDRPPLREQTSLVTFRVRSRRDPVIERTWTQRVEWAEFDSTRRDHALLAHYIGAPRFRAWLRSLMDDVDATSGERWSDIGKGSEYRGREGNPFASHFTLESLLARWTRDPDAFEAKVSHLATMLASFREAFEDLPDEEERIAALKELDEVEPFLMAMIAAVMMEN
ncbi:phospholipase D family protein [Ensifer sp. ENS10]|uniref:phospholipase D family protein n=1 Tax=Ensifer sp. ENS10 TaxID=2769286 RepID=UPI00178589EF|nr:phospholipase D family protein [Ensifer sp. ENS10]MBD9511991.1 phospholipase D family protein [Ensifer sp. ENS10]